MPEKTFSHTHEMPGYPFAETVAPGREKLLHCVWCSTCTSSHPAAHAMDYNLHNTGGRA